MLKIDKMATFIEIASIERKNKNFRTSRKLRIRLKYFYTERREENGG